MTLRTVLLSLQALLAAAEPDDPQDAVVANQVRGSVGWIADISVTFINSNWVWNLGYNKDFSIIYLKIALQ